MVRASRCAVRGHGRAEPNPLVGCVITSPDGAIIATGAHELFGGPHAEVVALRRAGARARGATLYVTLEPCAHHGKTPPCTQAIIDAGVARVIYGQRDPHPQASGGADVLRRAGIETLHAPSAASDALCAPFRHWLAEQRPWVTVKWAQTLDGRLAARTGDSKWISSESSRRLVHRERGRTDVILTGIGTVLRDDPLLNARRVRRRRVARRVVIDAHLKTPSDGRLLSSLAEGPVSIITTKQGLEAHADRAAILRAGGAEVVGLPASRDAGHVDLDALLKWLFTHHGARHVLVEAGPGVLGGLFRAGLVNSVLLFIAPKLLGDGQAPGPLDRFPAPLTIADSIPLRIDRCWRRGGDVVLLCASASGQPAIA